MEAEKAAAEQAMPGKAKALRQALIARPRQKPPPEQARIAKTQAEQAAAEQALTAKRQKKPPPNKPESPRPKKKPPSPPARKKAQEEVPAASNG